MRMAVVSCRFSRKARSNVFQRVIFVIPAKAGIHLALPLVIAARRSRSKMDSGFRRNDRQQGSAI
jgi:hypothetical protein